MAARDQHFQTLQKARPDDRRAFQRASVLVSAQMSNPEESGLVTDCVVFDLSANGAKIRSDRALIGARIKQLTLYGLVDYEVQLAWNYGDFAGLQFMASPEIVAETLAGILPGRCLEL